MALTAQFDDVKCNDVPEYLISIVKTPNQGFQGNFFAYLGLRYDAATRLTPVNLGTPGPERTGRLTINGDGRAYSLPGITLVSDESGATRRERVQLLEFQYPHKPDVAHTIPAVLANEGTTELQRTALGDDYSFGLDSFPEQLLGFEARRSKTDALVVRFSALRNGRNSFLEKLIAINNAQQAHAQGFMPEFEIRFSQRNFRVTRDNLVYAHVREAYGRCLHWPLPPLSQYIQAGGKPAARLSPPSHSPDELIAHELNRAFEPSPPSYTVETATFVFLPGTFPDFAPR